MPGGGSHSGALIASAARLRHWGGLAPAGRQQAQNDDFTVEVSTFEQPVHALQLAHCRSSPGSACQLIRLRCTICTGADAASRLTVMSPSSNGWRFTPATRGE